MCVCVYVCVYVCVNLNSTLYTIWAFSVKGDIKLGCLITTLLSLSHHFDHLIILTKC